MNEFNKHKKADKIKWILTGVAFLLIFVMFTGLCLQLFGKDKQKPSEWFKKAEESNSNYSESKVIDMPEVMTFSAKALAIARANGQTVDVKIKATVIPDDASNKAVDFSVEWGYATVHKDEAVTDFVTVTQECDGSVNATVSCKKAFDTDKIIVKVTTREGGFTAKCTITFLGVATSMNISASDLTPVSSAERGVYYQLGTKKTYTFNIALDNVFGKVGSKNLTATVGAVGNLYFGDEYVNSDSGLGTFSNMKSKPLSTYADRFITSATISENVLTVTVGSDLLESFYSYKESDEYGGTTYYDRVVFEDEYGFTSGDGYESNAKANTEAMKSCYFTVTVTDSVSELSETIRIWLVTPVNGVKLDKTEFSV